MSAESVKDFFQKRNLENPIFQLEHSGATVDLAAEVIGVDPKLIAKTLAFRLKDRDILVVTSGDARIDNKKYRHFFKTKAKMLDHEQVEEITGHPVGGVCPFGLKNSIDIYMDLSIKNFEFVYPAAGSKTTAMKISPSEIQELTGAQWIDVCVE